MLPFIQEKIAKSESKTNFSFERIFVKIYICSLPPSSYVVCKENILFCCVIFRKYFFRVKGNIKFIGIEKLLITVHQSNLHKFRLVSKDTYLLPRKWKILLLLLVFFLE